MTQRLLGLTGGIATGKSTVAALLAEMGIPILDADQLAREAVSPGSPILQDLFDHFGSEIQDQNGQLDRKALGRIVFDHPEERSWLEQQIHPYVKAQLRARTTQWQDHSIVCWVVPLLFEAGMTDMVTEIWVVTCPPHQQKQRLRDRDNLTEMEIQARIDSQWPLDQKVTLADVVLDNSARIQDLQVQVSRAIDKGKTYPLGSGTG
ncbi:MAG: dephospho-CoA kinase [Synechococcaceae cyanobacterium SM2_3_1]|nr:dephospho-CoA kinase [Synechococcaceae cyanobacterium SM2_3_1]